MTVPPGWPSAVLPPEAGEWEASAVGWLLDLCPPEFRDYPVLRRHPVVLGWLAGHEVEAQLAAARRAYGLARRDLSELVGPEVLAEALAGLEREGARLLAVQRSVALVAAALRGERFRARL